MSHWASDEIGKPWVAAEHDCWAFFRRVQRERYGLDVPAYDVDSLSMRACAHAVQQNPERARWAVVSAPQDGDAVLMGKGNHPTHVGIWVDADGGAVLHCVEGAGVLFQSLPSLRLAGWARVSFYRRAPA